MRDKYIALSLVCLSLVFYAAGEYGSKVWSLQPRWWLAAAVIFVYGLGGALWLPALRVHGQLAALSAVWSCLSILVCVAIGVWCFGEKLEPRQVIGLVLALVAVVLTL
jgi:multidrug transporter EmrE-like cation transporter